MPDAHDHVLVIFDRVENDIRPKTTDRQHSHIRTIFQVPHCRVFADTADGTIYLSDDSFSCTWIMPGNVGKYLINLGGGRPSYADFHPRRRKTAETSSSLAKRPCRMSSSPRSIAARSSSVST